MLNTAIEAAKAGTNIALQHFAHIPKVLYKSDNSPVTKADIEAEKAIRKIIVKNFPDHGIIGEELENTNPNARFQWVIDPIDGTKSFVRGIPDWGTLLAVLDAGKPIIGIYYSPATDDYYLCEKGKGTYHNDKKVKLSKVKDIKKGFIVHSSVNHFISHNLVDNLVELAKTVQGKRGAADCNGLNLLLKGSVDAYVSGHGYMWDYAGPAILTEEAGGKFSDLNGRFSLTGDIGIFTNGLVHKQVLNILNK